MTDMANEFQALMNEGAAIDAGLQQHAEAAAAGNLDASGRVIAPVDDSLARAMEWLIIPRTLAWAITAAMPETTPAYTDEKCMELARAFVPVADKYGWNGIGDAPELTLIMCGVGFMAPGFMAYQARKKEAKAIEAAAKAAKRDTGQGDQGARAAGEPVLNPINGSTP